MFFTLRYSVRTCTKYYYCIMDTLRLHTVHFCITLNHKHTGTRTFKGLLHIHINLITSVYVKNKYTYTLQAYEFLLVLSQYSFSPFFPPSPSSPSLPSSLTPPPSLLPPFPHFLSPFPPSFLLPFFLPSILSLIWSFLSLFLLIFLLPFLSSFPPPLSCLFFFLSAFSSFFQRHYSREIVSLRTRFPSTRRGSSF